MKGIRSLLFLLALGATAPLSSGSVSCVEVSCRVCPLVADVAARVLDEPIYCIA